MEQQKQLQCKLSQAEKGYIDDSSPVKLRELNAARIALESHLTIRKMP